MITHIQNPPPCSGTNYHRFLSLLQLRKRFDNVACPGTNGVLPDDLPYRTGVRGFSLDSLAFLVSNLPIHLTFIICTQLWIESDLSILIKLTDWERIVGEETEREIEREYTSRILGMLRRPQPVTVLLGRLLTDPHTKVWLRGIVSLLFCFRLVFLLSSEPVLPSFKSSP